jgi:hypothetical protein
MFGVPISTERFFSTSAPSFPEIKVAYFCHFYFVMKHHFFERTASVSDQAREILQYFFDLRFLHLKSNFVLGALWLDSRKSAWSSLFEIVKSMRFKEGFAPSDWSSILSGPRRWRRRASGGPGGGGSACAGAGRRSGGG